MWNFVYHTVKARIGGVTRKPDLLPRPTIKPHAYELVRDRIASFHGDDQFAIAGFIAQLETESTRVCAKIDSRIVNQLVSKVLCCKGWGVITLVSSWSLGNQVLLPCRRGTQFPDLGYLTA